MNDLRPVVFGMTVTTQKVALIEFLLEIIKRRSDVSAYLEVFMRWVTMMKVQRGEASIIAAFHAFAAKVQNAFAFGICTANTCTSSEASLADTVTLGEMREWKIKIALTCARLQAVGTALLQSAVIPSTPRRALEAVLPSVQDSMTNSFDRDRRRNLLSAKLARMVFRRRSHVYADYSGLACKWQLQFNQK